MELPAELPFNVYQKEDRKAQESAVCAYQSEFREQRLTLKDKKILVWQPGNNYFLTQYLPFSEYFHPASQGNALFQGLPSSQDSAQLESKGLLASHARHYLYLSLSLSSPPLLLLADTRLSLLFSMKWNKELFSKENVDYYPQSIPHS